MTFSSFSSLICHNSVCLSWIFVFFTQQFLIHFFSLNNLSTSLLCSCSATLFVVPHGLVLVNSSCFKWWKLWKRKRVCHHLFPVFDRVCLSYPFLITSILLYFFYSYCYFFSPSFVSSNIHEMLHMASFSKCLFCVVMFCILWGYIDEWHAFCFHKLTVQLCCVLLRTGLAYL